MTLARCMAVMVVGALGLVTPCAADERQSAALAEQLGGVIAAEEFCGLAYDQAAIAAFIEQKVAADDMAFPKWLGVFTSSAGRDQERMSASAKTAHCVQMRRIAIAYRFIR